jgi:hypothetical protein
MRPAERGRAARHGLDSMEAHGRRASTGEGSTRWLDRYAHAVMATYGTPQRVLVRVVPGIDADTHAAMATGGDSSKFGLPLDQTQAMFARIRIQFDIAMFALSSALRVHPVMRPSGRGNGIGHTPASPSRVIVRWIR